MVGQLIIGILVVSFGAFLTFVFSRLNRKTDEIHVLVNARMAEALTRITALEEALGLQPGQSISERKPYDP